jgi:hypothetical protein
MVAASGKEPVISSGGRVVISRLSVARIISWILVMALFCLGLVTVPAWGVDLSRTVFRLDRNEFFRVCEEIFFALGAVIFSALLFRRIISGNLAIYTEDQQLFWVRAFGTSKIPLADIATVEKWVTPGIISIRTRSGAQRYIATSVTDSSDTRTAATILALLERVY